jgi:hypothetical protein
MQRPWCILVMSSEVETSLSISSRARDSSATLGMTKGRARTGRDIALWLQSDPRTRRPTNMPAVKETPAEGPGGRHKSQLNYRYGQASLSVLASAVTVPSASPTFLPTVD